MTPDEQRSAAALAHLRGLSRALDGAVTIPGTGIRLGLDPLIGLVPVLGDWVGGLLSAYIVVRAAGLGASLATLLRMLGNLGLDALVGSVPVLGDIFDVGFRANERNLALIEGHLQRPGQRRRSDLVVVLATAGVALAVVGGALALTGWLVATLVRALLGG